MLLLALQYREASEILAGRVGDFGESTCVLDSLSVEIAQKAAVVLFRTDGEIRGHASTDLFGRLPEPVQASVIKRAQERRPDVDLVDLQNAFGDIGRFFSSGKYSYEENAGRTPEEIERITREAEKCDRAGRPFEPDYVYPGGKAHALFSGLVKTIADELGLTCNDDFSIDPSGE